jgi:beta-galactosidase
MRRTFLCLVALAGGLQAEEFRPEFSTAGFYQTDASVREAVNFNVGWRFIKRDVPGAAAADFNDQGWAVVNLPHGMELLPLAASGGVNYQGPAWYRKHFKADAALKGRKVMIHFEGIMGKSKIWLNGKLIRENFGGYFPIHLDVTGHLKFGQENVIAVRADNSNDPDYPPGKPQEALDFTYFGGIYRDVWLIAHNEVYVTHPLAVDHVAGGGVFVHYEEVSEKSARILVDTDMANDGHARNVSVFLELKDKGGMVAASGPAELTLPAGGSAKALQVLTVENPKLWNPDSPHLYDLFVTIKGASGQVLDAFRKRIGIRTIEMRGREGFFLNGKPYRQKLMGANRHQDFAHIGHALPNNLHWRDALKLRRTGMRVMRSAHYIQDPAFMDACDELGLFIVTAIPGWQFWNDKPIFMERMLKDVRNLVRLERNRPSVLLWEMVPNETHFPDEFARRSAEATRYLQAGVGRLRGQLG